MDIEDKLEQEGEVLQKIRVVKALDIEGFEERDIRNLLKISKIVEFEAGEEIIHEGTYENWVYYLLSGRVRIAKNRKELVILQRTGDIFGEMGVIEHAMRSASATAISTVVCLKINIAYLDRLPKGKSRYAIRYALYRGFAEALAERLRITTEKYLRVREELDHLKDKPV
jgi:CRP-like cAMP-binding protein